MSEIFIALFSVYSIVCIKENYTALLFICLIGLWMWIDNFILDLEIIELKDINIQLRKELEV